MPSYVFIFAVLLVKYSTCLLDGLEPPSVMALGHTLNIFCWVRLFGRMQVAGDMEYDQSHDRALMAAGFVKAPFIFGTFGPFGIAIGLVVWNGLFKWLDPFPRELLRVNRGYNTVFSKRFERRIGVTYQHLLNKYLQLQIDNGDEPDDRLAVAKAAFEMCTRIDHKEGEDTDTLKVSELVYLFKSWGIPDALTAAQKLFKTADKDHSGFIEFDEFRDHLWFIFQSIYVKGNNKMKAVAKSKYVDKLKDTSDMAANEGL